MSRETFGNIMKRSVRRITVVAESVERSMD